MRREAVIVDLTIKEGDTPAITIEGLDGSGDSIAEASINSINLTIEDYHSGTVVKASTDLSAGGNPVTYTLLTAETAILDTTRDYEYRVLTIDFVYDTVKHIHEVVNIKVVNI